MSKYREYVEGRQFEVPQRMQAVIACGVGFENVRVAEVAVPEVGPRQLLARVDAAGVCTSILKLIEQGPAHTYINGWDMERWPLILGDEGSVTIVKVGEDLNGDYEVGKRYAIQPAVGVGPIVHRERYNNNGEGMYKCGVGYSLPGHLAEYICIQEEVLEGQCLLELPDDQMAYFEVSMAEPVSCVYSAQQRNYHILKDGPFGERRPHMGMLPGGVTVVVGAGAMGRIHAEFALRYRPGAVVVSDLQKERLDRTVRAIGKRARERGVKLVCVLPEKLEAAVKECSGGRGADDIILAVGVNAVQQQALGLLAPGGVANLFGGLPKGQHILQLDAIAVHYREIKVVGSSGGDPSDMAATLQAIHDEDIDAGNYVAAVGSLDNAVDVLRMIKEAKVDGKTILYPHVKQTPLQAVEHWDKQREAEFLEARLG